MLNARKLVAALGAAAVLMVSGAASAQDLEKTHVELGVGGKPLLYYLPLTIAEQKGFFKEEGLDVTINDFAGGSKSLQALVGGSVDVVTGAYEHTIRMQVKGQPIKAVLELGRYPGIVLAVREELKDKVKTVADLKGMKIGVTAPGSSTNNFATYLLHKAGLTDEDVAYIGVGGGATAVAAMLRGEVDATSNLDPTISTLVGGGNAFVLADSRTEAGMTEIFGAETLPAAVLYTRDDFIAENPKTTQALVNALYKALRWLETATPEDVVATVPEEYYQGNPAIYAEAVKNSLPTYSRTGLVTEEGEKAAMELLSFDPEIASAKVDLAATFDPTFVEAAGKN
jgi:NitT/TauT family transport system substrate-binding protein